MKPRHIAIALAAWIALPAIAIGGIGPATVSGQPLTITSVAGPRLSPTDVRLDWTAEGLEVSGRIRKRYDYYGRILGHVDLDLLAADGTVVQRRTGPLQHFSPRRKDPDWASFRILIESVPGHVVAVRVQHEVGSRDRGVVNKP